MPDTPDITLPSTEVEIDVAHLDNIGTYLDTVADAITAIRDGALHQAHRAVKPAGDAGPSALGSGEIIEAAPPPPRD
jgi:hypothetical protein